MSIAEIKSAITQLPPNEVADLMEWLQEYQQQLWDRQIEHDLDAGRLNKLLAEVDRERESGTARPL